MLKIQCIAHPAAFKLKVVDLATEKASHLQKPEIPFFSLSYLYIKCMNKVFFGLFFLVGAAYVPLHSRLIRQYGELLLVTQDNTQIISHWQTI